MGCGCGGRAKVAVTSVNAAELELQRQATEDALRTDMASLVAAVHNANSTVVATGDEIPVTG